MWVRVSGLICCSFRWSIVKDLFARNLGEQLVVDGLWLRAHRPWQRVCERTWSQMAPWWHRSRCSMWSTVCRWDALLCEVRPWCRHKWQSSESVLPCPVEHRQKQGRTRKCPYLWFRHRWPFQPLDCCIYQVHHKIVSCWRACSNWCTWACNCQPSQDLPVLVWFRWSLVGRCPRSVPHQRHLYRR